MSGNEMTHDERWLDDLSAYALDALAAGEAERLELHLADCVNCRERLVWLKPAVDQIPAQVPQMSAPPALRARLMEIVDAEAEVPLTKAPTPAPTAKRRWLPSFDGFAMRPAFAGLAVVLLLAAGVVGYELHETDGGGADSDSRTYSAQAADGLGATGTLEVDGDRGTLVVSEMLPPKGGRVFQAWIMDAEGSVSPSVVFVTSRDGTGSVSIPDGLEGAQKVMITREPKGGSEVPSETPLMTATIT